MKHRTIKTLAGAVSLAFAVQSAATSAQSFSEALTGGETDVVFRLRYEDVEQDNALLDAQALTLRSSLQYTTAAFNGFSARLQIDDVRIVGGIDEYSVPPTGFNSGIYSVIADPETTELKQGYLQYQIEGLTSKLGRQRITYDNQRFIGAVGWRQDFQSFDAFSAGYNHGENLKLNYNYLTKRNRVFAEDADIDSKDHLINASYNSAIGTVVGYGYLLEIDKAVNNSLDSYGIRLTGSQELGDLNATYLAEFATQEAEEGPLSFDADYYALEGGISFSAVTAKLGYEVLGTDKGLYGFSTPLATGHAFNGWADMFLKTPAQGLADLYFNLSGKIFGGTLTGVYHDYKADDSSFGISDLGSEINLQYAKLFADYYTVGIKYANYTEGDDPGKPETQKFWLWFQASF